MRPLKGSTFLLALRPVSKLIFSLCIVETQAFFIFKALYMFNLLSVCISAARRGSDDQSSEFYSGKRNVQFLLVFKQRYYDLGN